MRPALCLLLSLAIVPTVVSGRSSVGDYVDLVRDRVSSRMKEALRDGCATNEVSGVVTLSVEGKFFLQDGDDGLKVICYGKEPKCGDRVAVSGKPTLEGGRVVFRSDKWRRVGEGKVPDPKRVEASDLIDPASDGGVNWLRVTVEGRAIGKTDGGFALSVGTVPVNVMMEGLPGFLDDCERTHPKVTVTGIAELLLDQSALLDAPGYVLGVKMNVGSADDIVLHPDVAYLLARRERRIELAIESAIALLAVGLLVFVVVVFRQRRRLFRTRTIMAERRRMADDIHDTIEQHLVGAGMLLKMNRLKEAQDVLVRAKREIRDIVWGLKNDDMMRLSPADMLRRIVHEENMKGIYRVDTRLEGLPASMDAAAMRDLSLIVREAIGNAVKHGGAKKIAISSDAREGGGWTLRISNDGTVFDPESAPGAKEGHFGLEGMCQRGRRIGANVTIGQRKGRMVVTVECNKKTSAKA